jgi:hypothetical protein
VRESGLPNTTLLDRVPSASNFDPLLPRRYADWVLALATAPSEQQARMLQMMDVAWVGRAIGRLPPWVAYEAVPGARRVRLVPEAVPADGLAEALQALATPALDFDRQVILEAPAQVASRRGGPGEVDFVPSADPGRVTIRVAAPDGGWLVLSDTWYPGWTVRVDSTTAESYPADVAFRAVWVPPGATTVTWVYAPSSFRVGGAVSLASLVVMGGVLTWWIVRRRSA